MLRASSTDESARSAAMSLVAFFEESFAPSRAGARPHRVAISWLERALERPPLLTDLAAEGFGELRRYLAKHGFSAAHAHTVEKRLRTIGKSAWMAGRLTAWPPSRFVEIATTAPGSKAPAERPPADSLSFAFEEQLRPKLAENGRSRNTINDYSAAVSQFNAYLGRYARPKDLNALELGGFRRYVLARGRSESRFHAHAKRLHRLARLVDPSSFGDRRFTVSRQPAVADGTLRQMFESSYRPERLIGRSDHHLRDCRYTLRLLCECSGRDVAVDELSDKLAADFLTWLLDRGLRAVTVNTHRARLFAIWRLAVERGKLKVDPRVRKLPEVADEPDAWSEAEAAAIIAAPLQMAWQNKIAGLPAGPFWHALLLVAYWTGLRAGSIFKLQRCDLDFTTGWLTVGGDKMKNRRGKTYRLGPDALAALQTIWTPKRALIFPWPHSKTTAAKHVRKIIAAAGVAPSSRVCMTGLHKMRRTVATIASSKRGLAVASELLGHSETEITKRYVDPSKLAGHDATEYLPVITQTGTPPTRQKLAMARCRRQNGPPRCTADLSAS